MKKFLGLVLMGVVLIASNFSMTAFAEENIDAPIRIEFEDYLTEDMKLDESKDASGDGAATFYTYNEQTILIPVKIEKSGFYDLSYVAGYYDGRAYVSKINFNLYLQSRFVLPCNNSDTPSEEIAFDTRWTHQKIHKFERPSVWIDANDYYLEVQVLITPDKQYKGLLDYFEFKPTERAKIEAGAVTKIELDEYSYQGVYNWDRGVTKNEYASGGAFVISKGNNRTSLGDPGTVLSVPVTIEKAGYYHINLVAGRYSGQVWLSRTDFKIDDVLIGSNSQTVSENLDYDEWDTQGLGLYKNEWIWLPSGDHELKVDVYINPINENYIYQYDYVEFIPATNGITLDNGKIKVHTKYFENKTGRVIMAAYNGDELVGCLSYDVTDVAYTNFEYTPHKEVTKVKVFLWNASNDIKPLEIEREFNLGE